MSAEIGELVKKKGGPGGGFQTRTMVITVAVTVCEISVRPWLQLKVVFSCFFIPMNGLNLKKHEANAVKRWRF